MKKINTLKSNSGLENNLRPPYVPPTWFRRRGLRPTTTLSTTSRGQRSVNNAPRSNSFAVPHAASRCKHVPERQLWGASDKVRQIRAQDWVQSVTTRETERADPGERTTGYYTCYQLNPRARGNGSISSQCKQACALRSTPLHVGFVTGDL